MAANQKLAETGVSEAYGIPMTLNGVTYIAQGKEF